MFDSADGGIAGATIPEIHKISSKAITRDTFWSESYLDPVEAFRPAAKLGNFEPPLPAPLARNLFFLKPLSKLEYAERSLEERSSPCRN